MNRVIIAEAWVQCHYFPSVLHKLKKGKFAPEYDCLCLGINLGGELRERDEVIYEEVKNG